MSPTCPASDMVAEKNCLHFWGQIATKVAKDVAEPILAPESRFRGIRWGNLHHFLRSICWDWSWGGLTPLTAAAIPESRLGGLTLPSSNSFFRDGGSNPPSSNSFPRVHCSGTCLSRISKSWFPRKQKPLLGKLIRDGQRFPGRVFPENKSPC